MKIREKIYEEIKNMSLGELSLLYDQIKLMVKIRQKPKKRLSSRYSIEEIQEMTMSSESSWAEEVYLEREERL